MTTLLDTFHLVPVHYCSILTASCLNCIRCVGVCLCMHKCLKPRVWVYLFMPVYLLPASPQLSSGWCVIGCVRTTVAGARGPISVSPVDISDGDAPASSPATSLMGEQLFFQVSTHCTMLESMETGWSLCNLIFPKHQIISVSGSCINSLCKQRHMTGRWITIDLSRCMKMKSDYS